MIDDVVFVTEMTILRDRFGRQNMTAETIARYLDFLSPRMSTAEFQSAAREVFNNDTWWPSPARFLDAVRGDPKAEGAAAWDALVAAASKGDAVAVTPAMLASLRRIGVTFRDVETASEFRLGEIGKRFRADFERDSTADRTSLPVDPLRLGAA